MYRRKVLVDVGFSMPLEIKISSHLMVLPVTYLMAWFSLAA